MKYLPRNVTLALLLILVPGVARAVSGGDVNGDGSVSVGDVTLTLQFAVGSRTPTPAQTAAADVAPLRSDGVYGDRVIGVADAIRLLRSIVGLETSATFPGLHSIHSEADPLSAPEPYRLRASLSVSSDMTHDFTTAGAYRVRGTVIDSSGGPRPGIYFLREDGASGFPVSGDEKTYTALLPEGTYHVYALRRIPHPGPTSENPGTTIIAQPLGRTLEVSGHVQQDYHTPPMPDFFTVSGQVRFPEGIPDGTVRFTQTHDSAGQPINGTYRTMALIRTLNGNYRLQLPAGTYEAIFGYTYGGLTGSPVTVQETLVVTGDIERDVTPDTPPLWTLTGSVTLPDNTQYYRVNNISIGFYRGTNADSSTVSAYMSSSDGYRTSLPEGEYRVQMSIASSSNDAVMFEDWLYDVGKVRIPEQTFMNFQVPAPPTRWVTVKGTIYGPTGQPLSEGSMFLSKGSMFFHSLSLTDAPGLTYRKQTRIMPNGEYMITLPVGEYQVD